MKAGTVVRLKATQRVAAGDGTIRILPAGATFLLLAVHRDARGRIASLANETGTIRFSLPIERLEQVS